MANPVLNLLASKVGLSPSSADQIERVATTMWSLVPTDVKDKMTAFALKEAKTVGWAFLRMLADYAWKRISEGVPESMFQGIDLVPRSPPMEVGEDGTVPLKQEPMDPTKV